MNLSRDLSSLIDNAGLTDQLLAVLHPVDPVHPVKQSARYFAIGLRLGWSFCQRSFTNAVPDAKTSRGATAVK